MKEIPRHLDSSGFVMAADYVPHVIQEIRYHSSYNFIGERIDGYEEPCAFLTREAARALKSAANEFFVMGYQIKIFDAYRPMKPYFYPDLQKQELFAGGYIAKLSSHSRGSTVDLTLLSMQTGKELDMGSPFDFFGVESHPDYRGITEDQYENRMLLQKVMVRNGFVPIDCEWWHFTLGDEPYPNTYFDFPVYAGALRNQ